LLLCEDVFPQCGLHEFGSDRGGPRTARRALRRTRPFFQKGWRRWVGARSDPWAFTTTPSTATARDKVSTVIVSFGAREPCYPRNGLNAARATRMGTSMTLSEVIR